MNYYIFKTDKGSGKTTNVCGGSHNDERECRIHWKSYMYGFMDGAFELLGRSNVFMVNGRHDLSFEILIKSQQRIVEYFMLFDQEGEDLIREISKTPTP